MTIYIVKNDILYTSNYGFEKSEPPIIKFDEFLLDCCGLPFEQFIFLTEDMYRKEIIQLPLHMKILAVASLVKFKNKYKHYQSLNKTPFRI